MALPQGTKASLISKLDSIIKSIDNGQENAAIKKLNAFTKQVKASVGKTIGDEKGNELIAAMEQIIGEK